MELHTCGVTNGPVLHQGQAVAGFTCNNTVERQASLVRPGDHVKEYALCGDLDDIVRIVGGEKLPCGRNGNAIKDGELRP